MPPTMDSEFRGRLRSIKLLMQAELAQLHLRYQNAQEPVVAEWIGRIKNALRALTVNPGGNGDDLTVSGS